MRFRKMSKRYVCAVLSLYLASLMTHNMISVAQEFTPPKEPSHFLVRELTAGTLGSIIGGIWAHSALTPWLHDLLNIPECRSLFEGVSDSRCGIPGAIAFTVGSALGSSTLVYLTGTWYGVKGSLPLTLLGGAIGSWVGWEIATFIGMIGFYWFPMSVWPIVGIVFYSIGGLITGSLATLGFNFGATMEVKALSLTPKGLELVSARARW